MDENTHKTICTSNGERKPGLTVFQERVMAKIRGLGYRVNFEATGAPASGKVIDDSDREMMYQTYAIIITW